VVRTPAFQAGGHGFDPRRPYFHLLNVFSDRDGEFGNALGVFLDGAAIPDPAGRQAIAADLGYSETVFVDDARRGELRIYTPATELPLAGHPLVGSAWLIARELGSCEMLRPPAGEVPTWQDGDLRWIRARADSGPAMVLRQYDSPAEVDALDGAPDGLGFVDCWAWLDEDAGLVRARVFAPDAGIHEDEATGAAALRLGEQLERAIEIRQGRGSVIHAQPGPDGTTEIGGRVVYVEARPYG
jgi:predicted PhzF superfamily epimerase YddE/YHI9